MPANRRPALASSDIAPVIKPLIKPLMRPLVKPVLTRLEAHEALLLEMKKTLDIQFKRIAEMQAQLDVLIARQSNRRP